MKKYYSFIFYGIVIIALGNSAGAGLIQNTDYTGSPLSSGTCNACHSGGNFEPQPVIEILSNGTSVDKYVPGQTYQARLTINASNFPSGFGFQMVALNSFDNDGGEFGTAPTGTRTVKVGGRSYFEQSRRLSVNEYEIDWVAPEAGTGDIRWYAVGNTVNANGGPQGDIAGTTSLTLIEDPDVAITNVTLSNKVVLYPVPVENQVTIDLGDIEGRYYETEILSTSGQAMMRFSTKTADLSELRPGTYFALIKIGQEFAVKRFVKL